MKILHHKTDIAEALNAFDVEDSIGLCFYNGVVDTPFVVAARQAGYVCDRLVLVNLAKPTNQTTQNLMKRIGADLLFEPQAVDIHLQGFLKDESRKLALIVMSLFQFMPLTVTVAENALPLIQTLKNLSDDFGHPFELTVKQTPHHLLNAQQKKVRAAVLPMLDLLQSGEADMTELVSMLKKSMEVHQIQLDHVQFYDADTYEACYGVVSPSCYVAVDCHVAGQPVHDIFTMTDL